MLFQLNDQNNYDAFLVKYDYTTQEFNNENLENLSLKTSMQPIDLNFSSLFSKSNSLWVCVYSYTWEKVGTEFADADSNVFVDKYGWALEARHCEIVTYYEEDKENYNYSSGTATITTSGSSMTTSGGGGSITSPTPTLSPYDLEDLIKLELVKEKNWIDEHAPIGFKIHDFLAENLFSTEAIEFTNQLTDILTSETTTDFNALSFVFKAFSQGRIYDAFDSDFLSSVNQFMEIDSEASNSGLIQLQLYFSTKCAVLRYNHPDWSDTKIYWEASKDIVHITLDVFGMIPVVGEVADLTNGVLYLIEGDGVNATLSFAATVPIVGWGATTGKYVFKITASTLGTKVRLTWKVLENGIVYFGSSGGKLRKVLGITDSALQAHHLIPWAIRNHDVVQNAAKSGSAFHINEALNGITVAAWRNQPNHNIYNNLIESKLDLFNSLNPNATIDEAYNFVSDLIADVRDWIINTQIHI